MDRVLLRGLQFYGYHGVHPEETSLGQRFELDIDVEIDLRRAGQTDDLQYTVNYSEMFALAKEIVEGEVHNLIESVADTICQRALAQYSMVECLTVEIRKPSAPVRSGGLDHVGVRIRRTRADLDSSQPRTANRAGAEGR